MVIAHLDIQKATTQSKDWIVNDFSITVATVNGSGSQTSNATILRALFKMGIPVSGKNLFPSNIQGLPTWYTIRVNKDGFLARREETEIVIAMNSATFINDMESLLPGGVLFYDDNIRLPITRQDIVAYPMPVNMLVKQSGVPSNLRDYISNMVYVGVLAQMIGINQDFIHQALDFHFKGKQKPIAMNWDIIQAAIDWSKANLVKKDNFIVEPMDKTQGLIMTDGNTAAAVGALYGGMQFCAWYPITPASSLAESINEYIPIFRKDPQTGKNTTVVIQAEDELAAIGMAVGAGWSGLRSMTSTSGPGLSLMTEYVGLAYYTEVPVVIWDVQRVGPSTGLPTRTSQGDLSFASFMGHGDTNNIIMLPGSINECFEFGWRAFDLADRLQAPVIVLSDLDFGMNQWMAEPFEYPDVPLDRGKVLWEKDLDQLGYDWGRYADVDGDGIPYRTIPGNRHPKAAYFARGTGHSEFARYTEDPVIWERVLLRLKKKYQTAKQYVPKPVIKHKPEAMIGIIAYGSTEPAIAEAIDILGNKGMQIDYVRLRALPFTPEVDDFIKEHQRNYVVELNRDGQLFQLLKIDYPSHAMNFISLSHLDGLPLTAKWVVNRITDYEEELK